MPSQSSASIPWPEDYAALQGKLLSELGTQSQIFIHRMISEGKSGALVMVADVTSSAFTGQAILKLDRTRESRRSQALEYERHEHAIEVAPEYADSHLPTLVCAVRENDQVAALTTIAGRGLQYAMAWINCSYGPQLETATRLSDDLLESWNANYTLDPDMRMPVELLSTWLGHRLYRDQGSRVHDLVETVCALDADAATFLFDGDWFPNPLALGQDRVGLPDTARLRTIRGNQHGDLHGRNVLVTKHSQAEPHYFLIDLDYYRDDGFLFYDHAIFELDYLLTSRETIEPKHWKTLLRSLRRDPSRSEDAGLTGVDIGIIQLVRAFRDKPREWIDRHQPNRLSFLESQYLLARVAAGLAISHQLRDDRSRALGFLYAAYNMKDYLALHEFEWPKHGPEFAIDRPSGGGSEQVRDTVVQQSHGKSTKPAIAVLPLDSAEDDPQLGRIGEGLTDSIISELSRIDWITTIQRTASESPRHQTSDPRQAGRALNARYVLSGSAKMTNDLAQISVHLIDIDSGDEIWSGRYRFDPDIDNLFANEDSTANTIAAMVNAELGRNEREKAMQCDPAEATGWQLQARARWHFLQVTREDDDLALRFARQAIEKAPEFSEPYAQIAQIQNRSVFNGWMDASDAVLKSSVDLARQAVALDPGSSFAHEALARAYVFSGQTTNAVREAETAVTLNPHSSTANLCLAICLLWAGKPSEALPVADLAIRLDPFNEGLVLKLSVKAAAYFMLGRLQKAEELARKMVETSHGHMAPQLFRALMLSRQGRIEEAREEVQKVLKDRPDFSCSKLRGMISGMETRITEPLLARMADLGVPE